MRKQLQLCFIYSICTACKGDTHINAKHQPVGRSHYSMQQQMLHCRQKKSNECTTFELQVCLLNVCVREWMNEWTNVSVFRAYSIGFKLSHTHLDSLWKCAWVTFVAQPIQFNYHHRRRQQRRHDTRISFRNVNQLWIIFTKVNYHFRSSNFDCGFLSIILIISRRWNKRCNHVRRVVFYWVGLKGQLFRKLCGRRFFNDMKHNWFNLPVQRWKHSFIRYEGSYLINWFIYTFFFHFEPKHLPKYNHSVRYELINLSKNVNVQLYMFVLA